MPGKVCCSFTFFCSVTVIDLDVNDVMGVAATGRHRCWGRGVPEKAHPYAARGEEQQDENPEDVVDDHGGQVSVGVFAVACRLL